jgi:hypothetical protein
MMWSRIAVLCLAGALAACAEPSPDAAAQFGSTAGTPFMIAFKVPVCVITVLLSAPLVGASGLAEPTPDTLAVRNGLAEGMAQNCGPPYTLTATR